MNYEELKTLIENRLDAIDELSKEDEFYNKEWLELTKMRDSLWKLIKNKHARDKK